MTDNLRTGANVKAQMKCSNCGAEISNISMGWDKRAWLYSIPFFIFLLILPLVMQRVQQGGSHDFKSDLIATYQEKRFNDGTLEIVGSIENHGTVDWKRLTVEAKLLDKNGNFLDQIQSYESISLAKGEKEMTVIRQGRFPKKRWDSIGSVKLRVISADHANF